MLSLSNCELGSEFSCNDGSCVPLEYKCDWFSDCSQGEDEVDCKALRLLNNYQKQVKKIIILTINLGLCLGLCMKILLLQLVA